MSSYEEQLETDNEKLRKLLIQKQELEDELIVLKEKERILDIVKRNCVAVSTEGGMSSIECITLHLSIDNNYKEDIDSTKTITSYFSSFK